MLRPAPVRLRSLSADKNRLIAPGMLEAPILECVGLVHPAPSAHLGRRPQPRRLRDEGHRRHRSGMMPSTRTLWATGAGSLLLDFAPLYFEVREDSHCHYGGHENPDSTNRVFESRNHRRASRNAPRERIDGTQIPTKRPASLSAKNHTETESTKDAKAATRIATWKGIRIKASPICSNFVAIILFRGWITSLCLRELGSLRRGQARPRNAR